MRLWLAALMGFTGLLLVGCISATPEVFGGPSSTPIGFLQAHTFSSLNPSYNSISLTGMNVTRPMTIEFFIKPSVIATPARYIFDMKSSTGWQQFYVYIDGAGYINFAVSGGCSAGVISASSAPTPLVVNNIYHVAGVWDVLGNTRIYLNGVQRGSSANSINGCNSISAIKVGTAADTTLGYDGQIDELRLSNIDRYIFSPFPPPKHRFQPDTNTLILMHMDALDTIDHPSSATVTSTSVTLGPTFLP